MDKLKLIALDEEDLAVLSSLFRTRWCASATWPMCRRRSALPPCSTASIGRRPSQGSDGKDYRRRRTALRFDRVFGAQLKNVKPGASERVLSLLAVSFEPAEAPGGHVTLTFSGDASIQLQVECIEAELKDLGPAWRTRSKPKHPGGEPDAGGGPGAGSEPGASGS